jgi:hypothetical protein
MGDMCLVHSVRIHNGGIYNMKHNPMLTFVILPFQGIIITKLILDINSTHVLIIVH